jgi:predicted  nucleic acid-binding Zn-ribbon protein
MPQCRFCSAYFGIATTDSDVCGVCEILLCPKCKNCIMNDIGNDILECPGCRYREIDKVESIDNQT